jgi:triacylglycerol lipase
MTNFVFSLTAKYNPKNALALVKLARLTYQTEEEISQQVTSWGFSQFSFITTPTPIEAYDTQALIIANSDLILVAFRGSESRTDWKNNLDFVLIQGYGGRVDEFQGRVHRGFSQALDSVWGQVKRTIEQFQTQGQTLWFTGHSLGAALATLAVSRLVLAEDKPVGGLYTYGSPRVGDRVFAQNFNNQFKDQSFRFVNHKDIVTRLPPRQAGYSHVGTFLYFSDTVKITNDLIWWIKFLDAYPMTNATVEQRLSNGLAGAEDHDIALYKAHLERDIHINPFLLG